MRVSRPMCVSLAVTFSFRLGWLVTMAVLSTAVITKVLRYGFGFRNSLKGKDKI